MSNPDPQSEVIDKILESFDTWDRCGRPDCQHNRNYVEAKSQILKLISEARIEQIDELIDLEPEKQFMHWKSKDIADYFHRVGKIRRKLEAQLSSTNSEANKGGE